MTKENLDNLTLIFWQAEDDALMEEFTIIESLMITRSGLLNDDNASKRAFRTMKTYGIFAVNHEFFPCNDDTAINDVQGSLISMDNLPSLCTKVCNACGYENAQYFGEIG
jgi:hypothetical protein